MARPDLSAPLRLLTENPEEGLRLLREGWIDSLASADDQFTDLHVLYALKRGLLDGGAPRFPDPRLDLKIPVRVLRTASVAGHSRESMRSARRAARCFGE